MNNETISAIASLWQLALIVFLTIVTILFRSQIAVLLNRFAKIQFRKGDTELVIVQQESRELVETSSTNVSLEESSKSENTDKPSLSETEKLTESSTLSQEELHREMFFAFFDNDIKKAEEIFNKLQSIEEDQIMRYRNEAYYLHLCFSKGDTEALEKLRKLEEATRSYPSANASAYYSIGKCHESVSQFEIALSAFEKAASVAQDETRKANSIIAISNCYFSLGKKDLAFDVLEKGIQELSNTEGLFTLYSFLAELFKKMDDKKMRAIALEKALEFQPNNPTARFNAAYSYGEGEFKHLTLYHYKTLIGFSPKHPAGLNNLGVAYKELQLPIQSIKYFKKSWKQKETLAAANLAYQYLYAGFTEEAQNIIAAAKIETNIHPNIGSALSAISKNEETETKTEQKIIENALEQQRFLLSFAKNYFSKVSTEVDVTGNWVTDEKISEFTQTNSLIVGTWGDGENRRKFSGNLKNLGVVLKFEKWGYDIKKMSRAFVDDDEGYAYFSSDLQTLHVMIIRKNEFQFTNFTRQKSKEIKLDGDGLDTTTVG